MAGACHELGRGDTSAAETPYCAQDTETHEVRCCSSTAISGYMQKTCLGDALWVESDFAGFGGCQHNLTWPQASQLCKSMNVRLCTKAELDADCTSGSGCEHNLDLIWSSTPGLATPHPTAPHHTMPCRAYCALLTLIGLLCLTCIVTRLHSWATQHNQYRRRNTLLFNRKCIREGMGW